MNKKSLIIIAVYVAIVFFSFVVFVFVNKTEENGTTATNSSEIKYTNNKYRFTFLLPNSWSGYSVIINQWEGYNYEEKGNKIVASGPQISIRHPLWTTSVQRQDIPIMIFTIEQWNRMQVDQFHIGAAPINPSELGRNSKYVFALPARYNYAFLVGFEEVERIINGGALKTF